jgi:hypothetical protein
MHSNHIKVHISKLQWQNTGRFKKRITTLKAYMNLLKGHVQCFELS